VEGLILPKGKCVRDQTFADDIALYLKGLRANMNRTKAVLEIFCRALGAKVNWGTSTTILTSRRSKEWDWGQEVGLKWIPEGEGVMYLGI
jgi:hypothetical protein